MQISEKYANEYETIRRLKQIYQSPEFEKDYMYEGSDLGAVRTRHGFSFTVWSPAAESARLLLFHDGQEKEPYSAVDMKEGRAGTWVWQSSEDMHGVYYNYDLVIDGRHVICADPYAKACSVNGTRSMAVDLQRTDPGGWETDRAPKKPAENIIYELHVKEFSWAASGGFDEAFRGKYKAFTCEHTTLNAKGAWPTGLDYLKQLGVTYVQLMPVYDFGSVDETGDDGQFNWGYDPVNYNVPDGYYATDAIHGEVRIREMKEMIQSLHRHGFRVIMDVVYNHTYSLDSPLQQTMPWYYYRTDSSGVLSNGSACGNDVATERPMCSKYILDSVLYWAKEYHIDGFRFDLMGLMDTELMNKIRKALDDSFGKDEKLIFGEPWTSGASPMERGHLHAVKKNMSKLSSGVGIFCDNTRDTIKGHVFEASEKGFVSGAPNLEKDILKCARAWCRTKSVKAKAPSQIISYVSAHDNWTLWDKLVLSMKGCTEAEMTAANRLAAAIYMTCQGSVFMLSGEEFARTKNGIENSYNSPIEVNRIDWERAYAHEDLIRYYAGLIALRKQCAGLCDKCETASDRFIKTWAGSRWAAYLLDNTDTDGNASWTELYVVYNAGDKPLLRRLPPGRWTVLADASDSFLWRQQHIVRDEIAAGPKGALILGKLP